MSRPALLLAIALVVVLAPAVIAAWLDPGTTDTYQLGAAPTSPHDRFNSDFGGYVAAANDRTPPTMPTTTTTTTAPKSKQVTVARGGGAESGSATFAPGERRGIPCGGDELPPCFVIERESMMTDDPLRVWNDQLNSDGGAIGCYYETGYMGDNPCGSTASGPWQILRSTWDWFAGYVNAADAPLHVQIEKVRRLWAHGAGCFHWKACRA